MKKYIIFPIYLLLIALTSCNKSPEITDVSDFTLSTESVKVKAEGKTLAVDINAPNGEWSYMGGSEWLSLKKEHNKLNLTVNPNKGVDTRKTVIVVTFQHQSKNLVIEQEGHGLFFSAEQKEINVDQWGKDFYIGIDSNTKDWMVTCTSSKWLEYDVNPNKKELHISVHENLNRDDRSATFQIQNKSGEGDYAIHLKQKGALYHVLPYMGFNETEKEVIAFEKGRRSTLTAQPGNGASFGNTNTNMWTFETVSKAYNRIDYIIEEDQRRFHAAVVWATNPMAFLQNSVVDDLENFLRKSGFEERSRNTFYNKETECVAIITLSEAGSHIRYIFEPKQPAPAPTFPSYPWGILDEPNWRTFDRASIEKWEKAHGGKYVAEDKGEQDVTIGYYSDEYGGTIHFYSINFMPENSAFPLTDVAHVYMDTDKVYYEVKGMVLPTKEFRTLALNSGFRWNGRLEGNIYSFIHDKRGLYMGAYQIIEPDPNDDTKVIKMAKIDYLHNPNAKTGNTNFVEYPQKNTKIADRIERMTRKIMSTNKVNHIQNRFSK